MKQCIWCRRTSEVTTFDKRAHIVPQALGGKEICENVCDECNRYFGSKTNEGPAIEEALKEAFHISRLRFLFAMGEIGKNKAISKPDSLYFKVDLKKPRVSLKLAYKLKPHFQERLCRLLKRGLFKMFLEESEKQFQNGLDPQFDFIREFARYDLDDFPVLYFNRKFGIILQDIEYPKSPKLYLKLDERHKFLISDYGFHEFEFMAHVFAIPTRRTWQFSL